MLCPFQIRPIRQAVERARNERFAQQGDDTYDRLCAELEEADRAAYEEEFGAEYRLRHPFKANEKSIHDRVTAMMAVEAEV